MRSPVIMIHGLATEMFGDITGVGLDFVDVQQVADLISDGGQPFLDACWTEAEQVDTHLDPERLAGRWAAKEAVMKCLRAGIGEIEPTDIEILPVGSGTPTVTLHGPARQIANAQQLSECLVTISHDGGWAGAIAVIGRHPDSPPSSHSREGMNGGGLDG